MRILRILLVLLLALSAVGRARAADDGPRGDSDVEELLKHGIALRRSGNDEAALAVFLDTEKLAPDSVRVLLHISTAAQAAGKWMMAYDYLQKAAGHRDDPYFQRHKAAIDNIETTIAQRVGQFRVRGSPAGAEVRLSGELIGTLPMVGVHPVEVGSYVLEVSKAGFYPLRRPLTIASGGVLTQEAVDLKEQPPSASFPSTGQTAPQGVQVDYDTSKPVWWRARWVTWALTGVGVAAAATGGIAWGIREHDAARWNDDGVCQDSGMPTETRVQKCGGLRDNIRVAEDVTIVAGIAAVAFGGLALAHGLTTANDHAASPPPGSARSSAIEARCVPGLAGVVCAGTF
jgi:hypothetical protein